VTAGVTAILVMMTGPIGKMPTPDVDAVHAAPVERHGKVLAQPVAALRRGALGFGLARIDHIPIEPPDDVAVVRSGRVAEAIGVAGPVITLAQQLDSCRKVPGWDQPEYLAFWEELIRTRVKAVRFNKNWEFSSGCTFEFVVAMKSDIPTLDAEGNEINFKTAVTSIEVCDFDIRGF